MARPPCLPRFLAGARERLLPPRSGVTTGRPFERPSLRPVLATDPLSGESRRPARQPGTRGRSAAHPARAHPGAVVPALPRPAAVPGAQRLHANAGLHAAPLVPARRTVGRGPFPRAGKDTKGGAAAPALLPPFFPSALGALLSCGVLRLRCAPGVSGVCRACARLRAWGTRRGRGLPPLGALWVRGTEARRQVSRRPVRRHAGRLSAGRDEGHRGRGWRA